MREISVSHSFYWITLTGYLLWYVMRWVWITLIIPLTKGMIEKDYSFIFSNRLIALLVEYIPFIKTLSNIQIFIFFASAIFLLTLASMALNYFVWVYIWKQKQEYALQSTTFLLQKYMSLGVGFFINNQSSLLRSKLESVPVQAVGFIESTQYSMQLFFEVAMGIVILFSINLKLALISLLFFAISLFVFQFLKKIIRKATMDRTMAGINFNSILQEIIARQSLTIATNNQKVENQYFVDEYHKMTKKRFYFEQIENLLNPMFVLFQFISIMIMGILLGNTVLFSQVNSVSAALVFIVLFHKWLVNIQSLSMFLLQRFGKRDALASTLKDFINLRPMVTSWAVPFKSLQKWILCKKLSFAYSDDEVIQNLSLTIPAGKTTLIMGANGSGKTTLLSLILRFYDCPSGTIFIDDLDIHDLDIPSWRSHIAYVAQDVILFNGTVRENMTYWYAKKVSQKRIDEVIKKVGLTEFLSALPLGIETNIGDGWLKFSGWQRQRIAIARALLCNPQIIIFDEATKSIDTETDDMIMNMLVNEFKSTTRIVVSHNIHHKKFADHVIVLKNPTITKKDI